MVSHLKLIIPMVTGELLFLFGLLAWIYGVLIQLIKPSILTHGLSHLTPWISVYAFTILSFVVSAIGFLIWRLAKEMINPSKE